MHGGLTPQELRAARKRLGLTQQEFADGIAMSKDSVASMEQGRKPIMPRTVKLVRALIGERTMRLNIKDVASFEVRTVSDAMATGSGEAISSVPLVNRSNASVISPLKRVKPFRIVAGTSSPPLQRWLY